MCLIAFSDKAQNIDHDKLKKAYSLNNDGWGVMHQTQGGLVTAHKSVAGFDALLAYLATVDPKAPCAVHLRMATHGQPSHSLAHPFKIVRRRPVKGRAAAFLMHNGILCHKYTRGTGQDRSDTLNFTENFARPLILQNPKLQAHHLALSSEIGTGNKLVLMADNQDALIVNEYASGAKWDNGAWYSTHSYTQGMGKYDWQDFDAWRENYYSRDASPKLLSAPSKNDAQFDPASLESVLAGMDEFEIADLVRDFPDEVAEFLAERYSNTASFRFAR